MEGEEWNFKTGNWKKKEKQSVCEDEEDNEVVILYWYHITRPCISEKIKIERGKIWIEMFPFFSHWIRIIKWYNLYNLMDPN